MTISFDRCCHATRLRTCNLVTRRMLAAAGTLMAASVVCPGSASADPFPTHAGFSLTYSFTTSTPASPIDVGAGRDLTVNRYLVTTVNDSGAGFLNLVAGRCTNIRFTQREKQMIDSKGYCNFKDGDGDVLYAEYTTGAPKPSKALTLTWTFTSGTGKYDGISGTAEATNSNNIDDAGAYQAAGRMRGSYKIVRSGLASEEGTHD